MRDVAGITVSDLEPMVTSPYGASSEDALAFYLSIYHLAEQIPRGSVTTYGHLAYLAGKPSNSRQAGQALKLLPRNPSTRYNIDRVPWWRVINASGRLSVVENRELQRTMLAEELDVNDPPYNLEEFGWFPEPDDVNLDFEIYEP